ncbi:hypothetical protein GGD57_002746, partial [Rhizobium esperanzae]|nr:hypothetical protein [Rhizobium esperanzae]
MKNSSAFVPLVLPNYNVMSPLQLEAPGLGHAGFMIVDSLGRDQYYEFGRYSAAKNSNLITNHPTNSGNVRSVSIPGLMSFDEDGKISQNSLRSALDHVYGASGMYKADTGVAVVTQFGINKLQYDDISAYLDSFIDNVNAGKQSYGILGTNCIQFVEDAAKAANLKISITQDLPHTSIPNIEAGNILSRAGAGFLYSGPNSWLGSGIEATGTIHANVEQSLDAIVQTGNAIDQWGTAASQGLAPLNTLNSAPQVPTAPTLPVDPISFKPLYAPSPLTSVTPLTPASLSDFRNFWDASSYDEGGGYSSGSGRGGSSDIYGGYGSSSWGGGSFGDDGSFGGSGGSPGGDGGRGGGGGGGGGPFDKWNGPDEGDRGRNAHDLGWGKGSNPFDNWNGPDEGDKGRNAHDLGWGQREWTDYGVGKGLHWATDTGDYDPDAVEGVPVLLDLSGNGLSIDELSNSSKFVDIDGDGYLHRTAWAGAGTGVLVIDANGDGKISQSNEFVFTEWDSSATSDLEALKHVFDTNGNGKLDAGDVQWSKFRVDVNGQLVTLDGLGITSIDLTPKGSGQTFSDGSAITGTTTFTRADGTTGTVGDAQLMADDDAYIVKTTSATKADSSVEKTILAYDKDGSLAFRNIVTTSADGKSVQTQFDDDGNGTFDRSQTNVLTVDASGVQTKTVSNFNADGSLKDRTTTVTSADHLTVTTTVDQDGDGIADQRQTFVKSADGSTTTTTQQLSVNGTLLFGTAVTSSADGLTKTTSLDPDGNGAHDDIVTETTTVAADGSRTKTVIDRSSNGKVLSEVDTSMSADGRTITVSVDADGNGPRETKTVTTSTTAASGDVTLVTSTYNTNASSILRSKSTTVTTANGLSKTTTSDLNADNVIDFTDTDVTVI